MKIDQDRKRILAAVSGGGLIIVALIAVATQSLAFAQESRPATDERGKETESKPMCPMMAGLKGIKLTVDSPPLLMARADELQLTEQQKQELKSIAEEAQRKAAKVLTADQQSMLGESHRKAMSMMEIAMMRSKDMKDDKSGAMCPMCKRRMEGMMQMKTMQEKQPGEEDPTSNQLSVEGTDT